MELKILTLLILIWGSCNSHDKIKSDIHAQNPNNESETINNNQNYPDSTIFWINDNYIKSIDSGKSVCECLSANEFVMLYFDIPNEKIIIQSSIYFFGLQTSAELVMHRIANNSLKFRVDMQYPLGDSLLIEYYNNKVTLYYEKNKIDFKKQIFKTLDIPTTPKGIFDYSTEMKMQLNVMNSKSLLVFPYTNSKDSLFNFEELKGLIDERKVSIGCSDDYHYNSMVIKGDPNRYFDLEYSEGKVTVYEESPQGRGRFEKINFDQLKRQDFYKEKQK